MVNMLFILCCHRSFVSINCYKYLGVEEVSLQQKLIAWYIYNERLKQIFFNFQIPDCISKLCENKLT